LQLVHVLVLVHEHVGPPRPVGGRELLVAAEQRDRHGEQVVHVDQAALAEDRVIARGERRVRVAGLRSRR